MMKDMDLNQGNLSQALSDEIMKLIDKYESTLYLPTVIGCLELVKQQIIMDHSQWIEERVEDDDD